jgi:hypothetical protein
LKRVVVFSFYTEEDSKQFQTMANSNQISKSNGKTFIGKLHLVTTKKATSRVSHSVVSARPRTHFQRAQVGPGRPREPPRKSTANGGAGGRWVFPLLPTTQSRPPAQMLLSRKRARISYIFQVSREGVTELKKVENCCCCCNN